MAKYWIGMDDSSMLKKLKKSLLSPWMALMTLLVLVALRALDPSFVESVRLRYFDTLIASRSETTNNIYTVNIDEDALNHYGQWPFDRRVYAGLIEDLYRRNAGLVVFNVLMTEPDRMGGDQNLARTLSDHPTVLANVPADRTKNQPKQPGSAVIGAEFADRLVAYPGLIANMPVLEQAAAGVGTTNTLPEIDGVNRRIPLIVAVDDRVYPSLGMEVLRVAAGDSTFQVKLSEIGVDKMRVPAFGAISTDTLGRIWIDWSQRAHQVSMMSLPDDFGGAIVIVGVAAAGLGNPVPTSVGSIWPQDLQAAVIGTMVNGVVIQRPDWLDGAEILCIIVLGSLLIIMAVWRRK